MARGGGTAGGGWRGPGRPGGAGPPSPAGGPMRGPPPPPAAHRGGPGPPPNHHPTTAMGMPSPQMGIGAAGGGGGGGGLGSDVWLHSRLSGDGAMAILSAREPGSYLFRPSSSSAGLLTLSFKRPDGEIHHVRITQVGGGGFINEGDPRVFPSLEELAKSKPRSLKWPVLTTDV
eukprot:CAMPEP_0170750230 /NCGR_PEP_ID=MMETSP0437-20130122/10815_1 /TAXON_ID=0 /ORGANISM="Sexangularia sp." /LENGTH=173 /DNA_ID=CAMNT_0011089201 /DNA_START=259 /DNA_END=780 /DNA_ORIENTATION=+